MCGAPAVVGRLLAGRVVTSRVQLLLGDTQQRRLNELLVRGALLRAWEAQCSVWCVSVSQGCTSGEP